ncbi:MAG TPA: hypothetical protein PKV21_01360 [bacterium]|nr:hypothetical protein [bacterium]HOM26137.1 hypothetical protein [bacterium]
MGFLKLNKENFKPLSFQYHKILSQNFSLNSIVNYKDDIFIASNSGIYVFPSERPLYIMNEENGLVCENIKTLEILNDKLYAIAEGSVKGLIEIDLKTGISKIIFSKKQEENKKGIEGKTIAGIKSDKEEKIFWIVVGKRDPLICSAEDETAIFKYNPETGKYEKFKYSYQKTEDWLNFAGLLDFDDFKKNKNHLILSVFPKMIVQKDNSLSEKYWICDIFDFDIKNRNLKRYIIKSPSEEESLWNEKKQPFTIIPLENKYLVVSKQNMIIFEQESGNVEVIWQNKTDKTKYINDIILTEKGLFVLTSDTLYLIPEIKN